LLLTSILGRAGDVHEFFDDALAGHWAFDDVLVIAKACSFLDIGGSLEVSEIMRMPG